MSNSIAPGSSADVNVKVTALTTNPNVPAQYKTIILKKNLVNGVNTLTQAMMNQTNTKYVIKYDYTLGDDITVPANCVLEFDGGSISGEHTITGNNTSINAEIVKIFNTDITLAGTWQIREAYPEWFGAKANGVDDDSIAFAKLNSIITPDEPYGFVPKFSRTIYLSRKTYVLKQWVMLYCNLIGAEGSIVKMDGGNFQTRFGRGLYHRYKIEGIEFTATSNSDVIFDNENTFLTINKCIFHNCTNVFYEKNVSTNWMGSFSLRDCLIYDISGYVFKSNGDINGLTAVGNRFYKCNSLFYCRRINALLFDGTSIEDSRIIKCTTDPNNSGVLFRGAIFNGCYIEGSYAQHEDDTDAIIHITGESTFTGSIEFNNCFINFEKYFLYTNITSPYEWSVDRSTITFNNCTIYRVEDNYEAFHYEDDKHLPTIFITGNSRSLIGKFNSTYQYITMCVNLYDLTNKPENLKFNICAYDYREGRYVQNTNYIVACPTNKRTANREGTLELSIGYWYFDTTLGKPIYWTGTAWVDATGATV